jgi:hypothetical protein
MNMTNLQKFLLHRLVPLSMAWGLIATPGRADLIGVTWDSVEALYLLSQRPQLQLRSVHGHVALFETLDDAVMGDLPTLFRDIAADDEDYFLVDHLHDHAQPAGTHLVYADEDRWALVRIPQDELAATLAGDHFLYPLPAAFDLHLPSYGGAARPLDRDPSAAVTGLLATVDPEQLREHVERLSFRDPSLGAVTGNVRTRHARRPETFESTVYLQQQLQMALDGGRVWLDSFRIAPDDSLMYNVVGELPGTDPDAGYYVVCAHYDAVGSRSRASQMAAIGETDAGWRWDEHPAPGADDNGSGVALVLESARALAQAPRPPWTIRFIAWSGEELGLRGSRHYAEAARQGDDHILGVLNFDMIGFNDLSHRLELVTNPASKWLVDHLRSTNDRYQIGLQIDVLADPFAGLSDHAPFWARGYDAVLGIENYLPTDSSHVAVKRRDYRVNSQYHSVVDLPDSINWELVARVTRLTVAALAQFGQEEGLPNLVVFTGDAQDAGEDLRIHVTNLGVADVTESFGLRVSQCAADSTACTIVYDELVPAPLPAGSVARIDIPWRRYGDTVLLLEVDPADDIAEEGPAADNRTFQQLRLVPTTGVVVFPNPLNVETATDIRFSGVPLFSRVKIMSLSGEIIWEGREEGQGDLANEIRWNATNTNGFVVASGVYIYLVSSFEGEMIERGKIAVVR